MDRQQLLEAYETALDKIEYDLGRQVLSRNEAEFAAEQVNAEFSTALAELDGIDYSYADDEDEEILGGNGLGAFLLQFGEEAGYQDYDDFLEDLAAETGYDPDQLDAIIQSDEEMDDELAADILDNFPIDDEVEDYYEDADEDYYEDDDSYYDEEVIDPSELEYADNYSDVAEFQQAQIQLLEDKLSDIEFEQALTAEFSQRESIARDMVSTGDLPPAIYHALFGQGDEPEQLATFSAECLEDGIDPATKLYGIDCALEAIASLNLGELGLFEAAVNEFDEAEFSSEDEEAEAQAIINHQNRKRKL